MKMDCCSQPQMLNQNHQLDYLEPLSISVFFTPLRAVVSRGLFSIEFKSRVLKFSRSKAEEEMGSGMLKSTGSSTTESSSRCTLLLSPKEA